MYVDVLMVGHFVHSILLIPRDYHIREEMMRRVECLRTVVSTFSKCHVGPIRLMDLDPEVSTFVPPKRPNDVKYYARGLVQCAHAIMRFTIWGVNVKASAPHDTRKTVHQVLLENIGAVLELKGAMISEAHVSYRDYHRFCISFDPTKAQAAFVFVNDPVTCATIPFELLQLEEIQPAPVAPQPAPVQQPVPQQQQHQQAYMNAPQSTPVFAPQQQQQQHQQQASMFVPQPAPALAPQQQQQQPQPQHPAYMCAPQPAMLSPQQQQQQAYMHVPQSTPVLAPQQHQQLQQNRAYMYASQSAPVLATLQQQLLQLLLAHHQVQPPQCLGAPVSHEPETVPPSSQLSLPTESPSNDVRQLAPSKRKRSPSPIAAVTAPPASAITPSVENIASFLMNTLENTSENDEFNFS